MIKDGRQWGATLSEIRADHVARYRFASDWMRDHFPGQALSVLDVGCGCGYGANLMAQAGADVVAIDPHGESIDFAREAWSHPRVRFELRSIMPDLGSFALAVAFEVFEHVDDAPAAMAALKAVTPIVIASVPNEMRQPFSSTGHPDHKRHYTPDQFTALLEDAGFAVREFWSQESKNNTKVAPGTDGATLIYVGRALSAGL